MFVTETVSPIQMAEPATGCYLKAVPCGGHRGIWSLETSPPEKQPPLLPVRDNIHYIAAIKNAYSKLVNFRLIVNVDYLYEIQTF